MAILVDPSTPRFLFFFTDTATTEIYTLSLHDALPIYLPLPRRRREPARSPRPAPAHGRRDRKSTRLNSSHRTPSYAVFCLKKKKKALSSSRSEKQRKCSTASRNRHAERAPSSVRSGEVNDSYAW